MCQTRGFIAGVVSAALAGAVAFSFGFASPQGGKETKPTPKPPNPDKVPAPGLPGGVGEVKMTPEQAAAMEAMMPGPQQAWLAERAGTWTADVKMWMGPGEPIVAKGTSTYRMILGGRFLVEEVKSTMMGEPFEAMGLTGYNNGKKQFELAWVDSMGTMISSAVGTRSADGKTINFTWQVYDPASNKNISMRSVDTTIDKDHYKVEMFGPGPDGKEAKAMELIATRSK